MCHIVCNYVCISGIVSSVFTQTGEGFYLTSPSEFVRFSVSAHVLTRPMCAIRRHTIQDVDRRVHVAESRRSPRPNARTTSPNHRRNDHSRLSNCAFSVKIVWLFVVQSHDILFVFLPFIQTFLCLDFCALHDTYTLRLWFYLFDGSWNVVRLDVSKVIKSRSDGNSSNAAQISCSEVLSFAVLDILSRFLSNPVWAGHSCIDCLLSMRILLPRTNTQENNLTSFFIFIICSSYANKWLLVTFIRSLEGVTTNWYLMIYLAHKREVQGWSFDPWNHSTRSWPIKSAIFSGCRATYRFHTWVNFI